MAIKKCFHFPGRGLPMKSPSPPQPPVLRLRSLPPLPHSPSSFLLSPRHPKHPPCVWAAHGRKKWLSSWMFEIQLNAPIIICLGLSYLELCGAEWQAHCFQLKGINEGIRAAGWCHGWREGDSPRWFPFLRPLPGPFQLLQEQGGYF